MNQDKSARYHSLRRRGAILSVGWSAAFLVVLAATPASTWLAASVSALVARYSVPPSFSETAVVLGYVAVIGLVHELGSLPLSFFLGFALERRYGLSPQSVADWVRDQLKAGLLGAAFSLVGFSLLYLLIRQYPHTWWAIAAAGFTLFAVLLARVTPVWLLPLFFHFKPLGREELARRLVGLAERAGVPVTSACEWRLSDRTKKGNAALAGLGRTRRILVSDTLLANHTDDEIEVVLAHELGHHAHHDIWKGLAIEGMAALLGFFIAGRVLVGLAAPLGLRGVGDVAGLPVLLLTAGCLSVALLPAANAWSRRTERAADRFALDLTANPGAFVSAMTRLGAQNLAEEHPPALVRWLFYSHPPMDERIEAARHWTS